VNDCTGRYDYTDEARRGKSINKMHGNEWIKGTKLFELIEPTRKVAATNRTL